MITAFGSACEIPFWTENSRSDGRNYEETFSNCPIEELVNSLNNWASVVRLWTKPGSPLHTTSVWS
jgi:hypothetical protein